MVMEVTGRSAGSSSAHSTRDAPQASARTKTVLSASAKSRPAERR